MRFDQPAKKIFDSNDLNHFRRSIAYRNIHESINSILSVVKSHDMPRGVLNLALVERPAVASKLPPPITSATQEVAHSGNAKVLEDLLDELSSFVDEIAPIEGPRRFGNFAFKEWYSKMESVTEARLSQLSVSGRAKSGFISELNYYFAASFGSNVRLDYGTGHELSFVAFVGSLLKHGVLGKVTSQELLTIFGKYYDLVRKLILTYTLEPAGSHGVWGLDDHFHFIYILGAAQFNDPISKYAPAVKECLTDAVLNEFMSTNLYINAIAFIKKIKSGPFHEHSPILYDIHNSVSLWKKVLSGLLKMYEVEVLGKFPVVQHFWFGGALYPWKDENLTDLPLNPMAHGGDDDAQGFINGTGVKTTSNNVSMTGAPWKTAGQLPQPAGINGLASMTSSTPRHTSRGPPKFQAPR